MDGCGSKSSGGAAPWKSNHATGELSFSGATLIWTVRRRTPSVAPPPPHAAGVGNRGNNEQKSMFVDDVQSVELPQRTQIEGMEFPLYSSVRLAFFDQLGDPLMADWRDQLGSDQRSSFVEWSCTNGKVGLIARLLSPQDDELASQVVQRRTKIEEDFAEQESPVRFNDRHPMDVVRVLAHLRIELEREVVTFGGHSLAYGSIEVGYLGLCPLDLLPYSVQSTHWVSRYAERLGASVQPISNVGRHLRASLRCTHSLNLESLCCGDGENLIPRAVITTRR